MNKLIFVLQFTQASLWFLLLVSLAFVILT